MAAQWVTSAGRSINVCELSLRQAITPDDLLGRVNAVMQMLFRGLLPVGLHLCQGISRIDGNACNTNSWCRRFNAVESMASFSRLFGQCASIRLPMPLIRVTRRQVFRNLSAIRDDHCLGDDACGRGVGARPCRQAKQPAKASACRISSPSSSGYSRLSSDGQDRWRALQVLGGRPPGVTSKPANGRFPET